MARNNTQVANNVPILAPIANQAITAGNLLTFYVSATDASGFYSLAVTAGALEITAALDPVYYPNSSIPVTAVSGAVVVQDMGINKLKLE